VKLTAEDFEYSASLNGDLTLKLRDPVGQQHEVVIPAQLVERAIHQFQTAQFAVLETGGTFYPALPEMIFDRVQLGHRDAGSQLLISVDRIGWTAVKASDQTLRHLRAEIDRLLTSRAGPRRTS
jgi:hypothetical protein